MHLPPTNVRFEVRGDDTNHMASKFIEDCYKGHTKLLGVIRKSRFLVLACPITSLTFKTGGGHGSMKREESKGLSVKDSQSSHFGRTETMGILV